MRRIASTAPWERTYGYARAVVAGPWVAVAGTTATVNGVVIGSDPYTQAMVAFAIAIDAVRQAGLEEHHVVRTRMYVTDIAYADDVGRAHHDLFGHVRPAATMVQVGGLADQQHLVEVELDAYAG